jgi:hydrogenase/urease accessory protein HupE
MRDFGETLRHYERILAEVAGRLGGHMRRLAILLSSLIAVFAAIPIAAAHEVRPVVVTISAAERSYDLDVVLNLEALLSGIGPEHKDSDDAPEAATYKANRALGPSDLRARFDAFSPRWIEGIRLEINGGRARPALAGVDIPPTGDVGQARLSTIRLKGESSDIIRSLKWTYPAAFGSSIVRLKREGQEPVELGWLKDGQSTGDVDLGSVQSRGAIATLFNYIAVGFTHIIPKGLDHILFVLGLYLLSTSWKPLIAQVTAFTIAHSITLALGIYDFVSVSPRIVEPLIALSIVYVAVENMLTDKLQAWRPAVVFGFGLLHGLGFAGVLKEFGLPSSDYAVALLGFNVGVEFGQLAVIALAFLATGFWFRAKPWYHQRIVRPASFVIAAAGLFWTIERVWLA